MKYYDYFAKHLTKIKHRSGNEYMALCPFHSDRTPSFSFNAETGVWNCFGCGEKGNIKQFLEKFGKEIGMKERSPEKKQKEIIREIDYEYRDLAGNLMYIKKRIEYSDGSKTFRIFWKSDKKELILYNLPVLKRINPEVIYFAEGEKCVHALNNALPEHVDNVAVLGYSASPDKEFDNSHIEDFIRGKVVYIFEDNDETGIRKAQKLLEKVKKYAQKVYVVRFREKEKKGYDVADFLEEGHTIDEALLLADLEYEAHWEDVNLENLLVEGVPERQFIDEDFKLPKSVLALVAGLGSVGKGYFLLYLSIKWVEKGYNVAYVTVEDDTLEVKRRLLSLVPKVLKDKQKGKLRIVEFLDEEILDTVNNLVSEGFEIIIIDPIGLILEEENLNSKVSKVMKEFQAITKKHNVNIIFSHHLRKSALKEIKNKYDMLDAIRGAGSLHNNARYVFFLKRNKDDQKTVEVYNAKNSYAPNDNDFTFIGLFPNSEDLIISRLSESKKEEEKDDDKIA